MHRRDVVTILVVTAVWGLAFVGIKEVLRAGPPLTMAGARFVLAGLLLAPLAARAGRRTALHPGVRRASGREVLAVGLLQTTALYGLGFMGAQRATAGASALLLNTNPIMVAVLAVPFLGERLRPRVLGGTAAALAGVAVISLRSGLGTPAGVAFLLTG
ncbi:MAG: DMT family transporter, partial [Acidimicrobiia bacterium]